MNRTSRRSSFFGGPALKKKKGKGIYLVIIKLILIEDEKANETYKTGDLHLCSGARLQQAEDGVDAVVLVVG
jgi:hypothetical protein